MTGVVEHRERGTFCFQFRPVTDLVYNSIALNAQLEGLQLWDRDVRRYINSDRVKDFSPIDDFLQAGLILSMVFGNGGVLAGTRHEARQQYFTIAGGSARH